MLASKLSPNTAREINNNPADLKILILQKEGSSRYIFTISRGPGDNYELLVSSHLPVETISEGVQEVKELLLDIQQLFSKEKGLINQESLITQISNLKDEVRQMSRTLSASLINSISEELHKNQVAVTY